MSIRVLGVLGGKDVDDERLRAWASTAHVIYGADSGADRLISIGFAPIVVGDFDSFTMIDQSDGLRLVQDLDSDTTDCDKLLALALADGHPSVTIICVEGDLPDHVLASFSSIIGSPLRVRIAFRRGLGTIVKSNEGVSIRSRLGQRVSLIPLTTCEVAILTGVEWPLDQATIAPGGLVSVSNVARADRVNATISSGCALLFTETTEVYW